jgi:hypothetical protein
MFFHTADDYHELNAGAHRNIPKKLRAPALVWHLAFWIQQGDPGDHMEASRIRRRMDTLLLTLCRSLMQTPHVADVQIIPSIMDSVVLFDQIVHWEDIREGPADGSQRQPTRTQKQVLQSTSRAVSITFRWHRMDCTIRCEAHTEYFTLSIFAEFDRTILAEFDNTRAQELSGWKPLDEHIAGILAHWRVQDRVVSANENTPTASNHSSPEAKNNSLADFSKYFFHTFWREFADSIFGEFQRREECADILNNVFADCRGWVISDAALPLPSSDLGNTAKEKFLPLIRRRTGTEKLQPSYECTISYLLDGRAVYMSTLGPQAPSSQDDERVPIEFILYACQGKTAGKVRVNRWQLGRVTNMILLAETRRLAALKDIEHLHRASSELRKLDMLAQKVREAMASDDPPAIMQTIGAAHMHLNELTSEFLNRAKTGLLYRIERSRYYVDRFRWTVQQLRIHRLEGDQPYDQFVERRIGAEFDFIDRLGKRYERATNIIAAMDQNYLAMRTNVLTDYATKLQHEMNVIQRWGELALIGVLVPYYIMHLLDFVVQERWVPLTTIVLWTFFGAIALVRMFEQKSAVYTVMLCVFGLIIAGIWLRYPTEPVGETAFFRATGVNSRTIELLTKQQELLAKVEELLRRQSLGDRSAPAAPTKMAPGAGEAAPTPSPSH